MTHMPVRPRDRVWTIADLAELPDDGLRYELVDGTLLVSAAPSKVHQRVLGNLYAALRLACPVELEVFFAPTDYQPTSTRSLQPDLLVVRRDDPGQVAVTTPLVLAVEVLSPSSRSIDRVLKRALYEQSGVAHYWVVDTDQPSITAWTLGEGGYGESAVVSGGQVLSVEQPFPISVVPTRLLD
jgi:Uma2 family endonuclease